MSQKVTYFQLQGGEDLVSPPLTVSPSRVSLAQNYECDVNGRLRRILGYTRFDGQDTTIDDEFKLFVVTGCEEVAPGDVITDGSSTATVLVGLSIYGETDLFEDTDLNEETTLSPGISYIVVCSVTGAFTAGPLYVDAVEVGAFVSIGDDILLSKEEVNVYTNQVAQLNRVSIGAVPGSGPVLGVWVYNGDRFAFRNSSDGTEAFMYKATSSGWGLITTPELAPDGRYEFCNYNCIATGSGFKMYGVDGKNKLFQYDGTTFTQITTGYAPDTPSHVFGHKLHLFVSMSDGVVQHSGLKTPTSFDIADGAGYIGFGDFCSGFGLATGDILVMFGRNSTNLVYGSASSGDAAWSVVRHSPTTGALPYSIQMMNQPIYLDDHGITALSAVQEYGNFASNAISKDIKPFIDKKKNLAVASMVLREKGIYRLFYSDGYASSLTFANNKLVGSTRLLFPDKVACCCSVEDGGEEVILFGGTNGFVYKMEEGYSFDGQEINSKVTTHYNNIGLPRNMKRIHKAVVECETEGPSSLSFISRFSNSSGTTTDVDNNFLMSSSGGIWDKDNWNEFVWYTGGVNMATSYINGSGLSFSFSIRSVSSEEAPHTINGLIIHYSTRGMHR